MASGLRKILVMGGSGFVGHHLVEHLVSNGDHVIATTTRIGPRLKQFPNLEWVEWNALGRGLPDLDWQEIDAILHLAVPRSPFVYPGDETSLFKIVTETTFKLLEQARISGVRRMVLASTGDVLGEQCPALESNSNFAPNSFYGAAKASAEILVRSYEAFLSCAIARIYHPYGPEGNRFLINRLVSKVINGEAITLEGPNGIRVNPIYIDDLVAGIRLAIHSDEIGVFNLAGPDTVTLREFLDYIGELVGREPVIKLSNRTEIGRHVGDITRATSALKFNPTTSLKEGIHRVVELVKITKAV